MSATAGKRKKSYYVKAAKGKRARTGRVLEPGLRGFLLTCNNREKEAVRESYNILNEYADEIFGLEENAGKQDLASNSDDDDDEDISAALQKEVATLKGKPSTKRRFQLVDSGANNCIFIRTTLDNPNQIAHKLFSDLYESQQSKSRFIMRLLPVIGSCRVDEDKLQKLADELLPHYFGTGVAKTYCVLTKIRNNNTFSKNQVLPILRRIIQDLNPGHDFDPDKPDYVININIIKSVCCMSILEDFFTFRKYNVQEVVSVKNVCSQKDTAANKHKDDIADVPKDTTANIQKDDTADVQQDCIANIHMEGAVNVQIDDPANVPKDDTTDVPKDDTTDVPKDDTTDVPKDDTLNLQVGTSDVEKDATANMQPAVTGTARNIQQECNTED